MKICIHCGKEFGPRANCDYCFDCLPRGLKPTQIRTIKAQLERERNPIILKCPVCNKEFELPYGEVNRKYCFECMPKGIDKNEMNRKLRLFGKTRAANLLGGKCLVCGFDKYSSALEFHHLDGEDKEFNIGHRFTSFELSDEIVKEVEKCILLCSNCHRAYHAGELELENESN